MLQEEHSGCITCLLESPLGPVSLALEITSPCSFAGAEPIGQKKWKS